MKSLTLPLSRMKVNIAMIGPILGLAYVVGTTECTVAMNGVKFGRLIGRSNEGTGKRMMEGPSSLQQQHKGRGTLIALGKKTRWSMSEVSHRWHDRPLLSMRGDGGRGR